MNLFKKLAENLGFIEENKTEKIMQEREKIKNDMRTALSAINFSEDEIKEVLDILEKSQEEIQKHKDSLIGTNINNPHFDITRNEIFKEIRSLEIKAGNDMKAKIAEIKQRKGI